MLSQVNYQTKELETVYKCHEEGITSICLSSGFCITGSEDFYLRVWPLDFSEFSIEAKHEGILLSLDISLGALKVACGTSNGGLGVQDLSNNNYKTFLRSHTSQIIDMQIHSYRGYLVTLSADMSIRLWDMKKYEQVYEFSYPQDDKCLCISLKTLEQESQSAYQFSAFSPDSEYLALIGDSGTHINIIDSYTLGTLLKIYCQNANLKKLFWSNNNCELFVLTEEGQIKVFGIQRNSDGPNSLQAYFLREVNCIHRNSSNSIALSKNFKYVLTVGGDNLLKIWDYDFSLQGPGILFVQNDTKIITAGGFEGIYEWEFLGDTSKYEKVIDFGQFQPVGQNAIQQQGNNVIQKIPKTISQQPLDFLDNDDDDLGDRLQNKQFQGLLQGIQPVQSQEIEFKKQKKKREKKQLQFNYETNLIRKNNSLPFKHYYLPNSRSEQVQEKILKIRDNKEEFLTEFMISYNNDSHENVVWNYMCGWFAYTTQNFIIIENLTKNRNQKIITLPDQISCLALSRDFKYLLAGSASYNQKDQSNIYVLECKTYTITKTLIFHTRGVQNMTFSQNGKYLVTVGNFKECTVAVWEFQQGKLLANAYTLDRINDVKISQVQRQQETFLEFCTVGRDTIQFWELDKQFKLSYFDVFVPKQTVTQSKNSKYKQEENQQLIKEAPEVTALDYILIDDEKEYVVAGLSTGEIVIVEYGNYKILYRCQVSLNSSQIIDIKVSNSMHRLIVTAMDEYIHYWDFEKIVGYDLPFNNKDFLISWARLKISGVAISINLDPTFKEGFIGLYSGGISYINLDNKYRTQIAGTIDNKYKYQTHILNERLMVTTHEDGKMKFWNMFTAEEVMEYKFQSPVTSILFENKTNKLFCFFQNNNDIKTINTSKFYQSETFLQEEVRPSNKKSSDYPIKSFETILGGRTGKFIVMKSGVIYTMDQLIKERRPLIKFSKVFNLPNIADLISYQEKSLFFATNNKGKVMVYQVDYVSDRTIPYGFTIIDECDFLENATELYIKQNFSPNQQCLYEKAQPTQIVVSRHNENNYYAINETIKYVFIRNYQKRQITQRINLNELPLSITLIEQKLSFQILIGQQNGCIEKINVEDKDNRDTYTNMLDGGIISLYNVKSNNTNSSYRIIASTQYGITFYQL
ncbi:notchless, putative [Ichthyophthirius multifiliis]|uniref:Notchless, putative n=1 Tax=Ichthyophthirius multifiliis TaxID=5932 RepID=G0QYL4_ICHMU|nr:notchless, putative [Ichthyophthirius multifiliis]EGR29688.1 notchless, putative [Ichthyophthirius multifiliis]|eukprot:XP_004030924.1 notchless, putative [Ichthyophthirius multifiliis]